MQTEHSNSQGLIREITALVFAASSFAFATFMYAAAIEINRASWISRQGGAGFSLNAPLIEYGLATLGFALVGFIFFLSSRPIQRLKALSPITISTLILLLPAFYVFSMVLIRIVIR